MDQHNEGLPRDRRLCFALHGCRWQEGSSQESKVGKVKYREINGARQGGTFSMSALLLCALCRDRTPSL